MKRETIEKILNFLYEKEGKGFPQNWNLIKSLETHPDGSQYAYHGDLDLSGTNITKLPKDLFVDGNLYLDGCQYLTELPNELYVEHSLGLRYCKQLTELPDDLHVGGSLDLVGTNIEKLPNNLYVGVNLYINNTPLAKKYTDDKIIKMITSKGGTLIGKIFRYI